MCERKKWKSRLEGLNIQLERRSLDLTNLRDTRGTRRLVEDGKADHELIMNESEDEDNDNDNDAN